MLNEYFVNDFVELEKKGYQVIKNAVVDTDQLEYDILRDISELCTRHHLSNDQLRLLQEYGAGQWESAWKCRIATIPVWQALYKTKYLISSWDGLTYVDATAQVEYAKQLNSFGEPNWIHRDQNLNNSNLADTIQGYLSLSNGSETSYSTMFYSPREGSAQEFINAFHKQFR